MPTYPRLPDVAMPLSQRTQEDMARRAAERLAAPPARAAEPELVTEHVPPWRSVALDALPSAAASFARGARAAGLEVAARAAGNVAVQVGVKARDEARLWQRATWVADAAGKWKSTGALSNGRAIGVLAAKREWSA